jgi:ATP-dependent RNA helicase RhlE
VGDAFTLMSPEEQKDVVAIERLLGRAIPRVLLPDFDYSMRPTENRPAPGYEEDAERGPDKRRAAGLQAAAARIAAHPVVKAGPGQPTTKGPAPGASARANGGGRLTAAPAGAGQGARKGSPASNGPPRSRPASTRSRPRARAHGALRSTTRARVAATSRPKSRPASKRRRPARAGAPKRR